MFSFATLLASLALVRLSVAGYTLEDDYSTDSFFNQFTFFTDTDPTNGFVKFVDQSTAQSSGLINATSGSVYMGVDSTNVTPNGRPSVRITSNKSYNSGLIVVDIAHMPGGVCGTWPAFWTVGPDWPSNGEIDIVEGVNDQTANDMTLHTGPGCSISGGSVTANAATFSGTVTTQNCDVNAEGQDKNSGCQIQTQDTTTYGDGFNSANGGVYATEWTDAGISVYFFSRDSIPQDITSGSPDPTSWGLPLAKFAGSCDIPTTIKNQQIVFDTTFCGDWAGNSWSSSSCASKATSCNAYVQNNPQDFQDAYWEINSLKVYQSDGSSGSTNGSTGSSSAAASTVPVSSAAPSSLSTVTVSVSATSTPATSAPPSVTSGETTPAVTQSVYPWSWFGNGNPGEPTNAPVARSPHWEKRHAGGHRHRRRHGGNSL